MLRSILIPLDGSDLAERALVYATALSIPTAARLVLVRAVPANPILGQRDQALAEAKDYLTKTARNLSHFECKVVTPVGAPAQVILEQARVKEVDLIAISTHGRTGPGRWLFGSVAEAVVAQSPLPVLVERAWQPLRRDPLLSERPEILVPLDGSVLAETAAEPAAALADDLGAGLVLLRVEPEPTHVIKDEFQRVVSYLDQQEAREREQAEDYLQSVAEGLLEGWPELSVRAEVRFGRAAHEIGETEEDPRTALVVMATHGRTGFRRTLFGSIAGQVLEHHSTPVVLVNSRMYASSSRVAACAPSAAIGDSVSPN